MPKIIMRRETHYGQNQGMPNLPDEYLLTLSDDSDYCSSDWESDTDTELDPDEMRKEGRLGWALFSFTIVYLAVLITAYVVTSETPLCVCHEDHPKYNTSAYKDTYCTYDKYRLEKGSINYKKCAQYIKGTPKLYETLQINDTFDADQCTMQYTEIEGMENQFTISCNEHLSNVDEAP